VHEYGVKTEKKEVDLAILEVAVNISVLSHSDQKKMVKM
jgi:hypothetical protein